MHPMDPPTGDADARAPDSGAGPDTAGGSGSLTPLGRRRSVQVQSWHVRWTQVAEALRAVHTLHAKRRLGPKAKGEALERLGALPLSDGFAIPGATIEAKGAVIERTLLGVLGRLRKGLTTPVSPNDLASQAILCWCLHVLEGLPIKAVAREFARAYLAREPDRGWKGTGWDAGVRDTTVRARMWPRGVRSPHDYLPGAGAGL